MGPRLKFVSANRDINPKKKVRVNFFPAKKTIPGGVQGGFDKRTYFFTFFLEPFPKQSNTCIKWICKVCSEVFV